MIVRHHSKLCDVLVIGIDEPLGIRIIRTSSQPPQALVGPTHTFEVDTYSVCWNRDGTLTSTGESNITLFNERMQPWFRDLKESEDGVCIREYIDGYLIMVEDDNGTTLQQYSADLKKKVTLTGSTHRVYNRISVSEMVIVAAVGDKNQLAIYHAKTLKHEYKINLVDITHPQGVCIYNKCTVLVTDSGEGQISLYELKKDGKHIWTCEGLNSPSGICVDNSGFIYVACLGSVMVITKDGE